MLNFLVKFSDSPVIIFTKTSHSRKNTPEKPQKTKLNGKITRSALQIEKKSVIIIVYVYFPATDRK